MKNGKKSTLMMVALIMVTVFFYIQPRPVEASPETVIGIKDDLRFSMSIPSTTIAIGSIVRHTMTVENIGSQAISIAFRYYDVYWKFDIFLYTLGDTIVTWYSVCMWFHPAIDFKELAPGESYTEYLYWNYYLEDCMTGEQTPPEQGTYRLRGLFRGEWPCESVDDLPGEHVHIWTQAMTIHLAYGSVGGTFIPVDRLGLLAPYVGVASTIMVATAATAILVKRGKSTKERQ